MKRFIFTTDFNLTTEYNDEYTSLFMSECGAFEETDRGFEIELDDDDVNITSDYTAIISNIIGYGPDFEIDLEGMIDDNDVSTITDFIIEENIK